MLRVLKIGGVSYKIKWHKVDAVCPDDGEECCAYVSEKFNEAGFVRGRKKQALLSDMIHEAIHAQHPDWPEKKVSQLEREITQFLIENRFINWNRLK